MQMKSSIGQEERNLNKDFIINKFRNNVMDFLENNTN